MYTEKEPHAACWSTASGMILAAEYIPSPLQLMLVPPFTGRSVRREVTINGAAQTGRVRQLAASSRGQSRCRQWHCQCHSDVDCGDHGRSYDSRYVESPLAARDWQCLGDSDLTGSVNQSETAADAPFAGTTFSSPLFTVNAPVSVGFFNLKFDSRARAAGPRFRQRSNQVLTDSALTLPSKVQRKVKVL
jgi:hypothetical protein